MANIEMPLNKAGFYLEHICKIMIQITDFRYRQAVYRVVGAWLNGAFQGFRGVVVFALAQLDSLPGSLGDTFV